MGRGAAGGGSKCAEHKWWALPAQEDLHPGPAREAAGHHSRGMGQIDLFPAKVTPGFSAAALATGHPTQALPWGRSVFTPTTPHRLLLFIPGSRRAQAHAPHFTIWRSCPWKSQLPGTWLPVQTRRWPQRLRGLCRCRCLTASVSSSAKCPERVRVGGGAHLQGSHRVRGQRSPSRLGQGHKGQPGHRGMVLVQTQTHSRPDMGSEGYLTNPVSRANEGQSSMEACVWNHLWEASWRRRSSL